MSQMMHLAQCPGTASRSAAFCGLDAGHWGSRKRAGALSPLAARAATLTAPPRGLEALELHAFQPVAGPSAWKAADYRSNEEWVYHLTDADIQELESAVAAVQASGKSDDIKEVTAADFKLPELSTQLAQLKRDVVHGRGFALIKGLPVDRWTTEQSVIAYWGIGTHLGPAVSQNAKRHLVGHVKDIDLPGGSHNVANRIYATAAAQPVHVDPADVVGLLCLKQAKEGGLSSWASSHSIHNAMLESHPELVRCMAQPWFVDRKNEVPEGKLPFYSMPIFHYHKGKLLCLYEGGGKGGFILSAQRHDDVPRLTDEQLHAIEVFDGLAASDELRMDYVLEHGDIQLLHNHQIVHTRSEYLDFEDKARRRHLLRLWVSPLDGWALPEVFSERYGGDSVEPGKRGGILVSGYEPHVPLEAA